MSNPLSGIPDPENARPVRRRFQPSPVREALREMQDALQTRLRRMQPAFQRLQYRAEDAGRWGRRYAQDLWYRGKRNPRRFGLAGGAVALTLAGAYAVSASMANRSRCPAPAEGKAPKFLVLMDSVPAAAAGSRLEIQYEVCGLALGTPYKGKVRLVQQQRLAGKKNSSKPKPTVVSFKDRADGVSTRRQQPVSLTSIKPGSYTLELVVADSKGRERKSVQKIIVRR